MPQEVQQDLRRRWYGRQIRRGHFNADEPEVHVLPEYVRAGDCVVDVGANIGHYTCALSNLVGPNGRVIAFEPLPEAFALLAWNCQHFQHANITLLNVALSDRSGCAHMEVPTTDAGLLNYYQAHIGNARTNGSGRRVLTMAFDSLPISSTVSLIKIDAEQHDEQVLRGMLDTIDRNQPVLIVESPTSEVAQMLSARGYFSRRLPSSPNTIFEPPPPRG